MTVADIERSLQRRSDHSTSSARCGCFQMLRVSLLFCIICRQFNAEVPSSAAMSEMQQELRDVRSEVQELKQLMRTSFDLQLEIQRAIRQEVAAVLSSVHPPPSSVSLLPINTGMQHSSYIGYFTACKQLPNEMLFHSH